MKENILGSLPLILLIFKDHHYGLAEAQLIAKSLETNDTLTALNLRVSFFMDVSFNQFSSF